MAEYIVPAIVVVGAVAAVAGAGISTYSAIKQRQDQQDQLDAIDAQKRAEAQEAKDSAAFEEQQHRRRIALLQGQTQAAYGAAGMDTSSGTPLIDSIDLAQQGEMEALMLKRSGQMASAERMFEAGVASQRSKRIQQSYGLTYAGGVAQGIGGASTALSTYRPTTTQIGRARYTDTGV